MNQSQSSSKDYAMAYIIIFYLNFFYTAKEAVCSRAEKKKTKKPATHCSYTPETATHPINEDQEAGHRGQVNRLQLYIFFPGYLGVLL